MLSRRQSERNRRRSRVAEESLEFEIRQPLSQMPEQSKSSDRGRRSSRGRPVNSASTRSTKSYGNNIEIDLFMECHDEPLSQCQIEMAKKVSVEYTKSLELIAAARSGRLVYLPNGKTKILDHPFGAIPELQPQKEVTPARPHSIPQSPVVPVSQTVPKDPGRSSPDIIFVGETPPSQPPPQVQTQGARKPTTSPKGAHPEVQGVPAVKSPVLTKQLLQTGGATSKVPFPGSVTSAQAFAQSTALASLRTQMQSQALAKAENDTQKKRIRKHPQLEGGGSGNWVPLDEFYYGKTEGNPTYQEAKGEYRFKCWYCNKMLYNNIAAMLHIQGHIDSDRQVNLDITDLTQCKHCFKQFDTPFEMQTHIEKVHMNNTNVLLCRICEKDHESRDGLKDHMKKYHNACEMPYICHLCQFRSSMYSDVVDHFKKKHTSSEFFLCLYCLRVFHVRFIGQGWGQTNVYYNHLLKHQMRNSVKKCHLCKLIFLNAADLKEHRLKDHQPNQKGVIGITAKYTTPHQVMIKLAEPFTTSAKPNSGVKSLNVKSVCNVMQHTLVYPPAIYKSQCVECRMIMGIPDHYKQFIHCSMCRFASSCSFAYSNHMMGFHSGQLTAAATRTATERPLDTQMYCSCGFVSSFGNRIANHLVSCSKRSCYSEPPALPESSHQDELDQRQLVDPRKKPGASLLDVLGLVKKNSLQRSKPFQAESPPPSPVEMPEVDLNETPPKRPSLLKGSVKKSFKDILKHTFDDVQPAEDASLRENKAEQMPTLTPCKVVLTSQDLAIVASTVTTSPPKIEMGESLSGDHCGRKRTKIGFHTDEGTHIVDKSGNSSLSENISEESNISGDDVDKVEDDIPPLVKETDLRTEDGSNHGEGWKIPELEKFESNKVNNDDDMSSGDEPEEKGNLRESQLQERRNSPPTSTIQPHETAVEKNSEDKEENKTALISGGERDNVFKKLSLSLQRKEVKEGGCVLEKDANATDGNKIDTEEKSKVTEAILDEKEMETETASMSDTKHENVFEKFSLSLPRKEVEDEDYASQKNANTTDRNKIDKKESVVIEGIQDKAEVPEINISCEGDKMEECSSIENPPDLLKGADLDESPLDIPESCAANSSIPVEADDSVHQGANDKENNESIPEMEPNICDEDMTESLSAGEWVNPNADSMPRLSPMVDDGKGDQKNFDELKSTTGIEELESDEGKSMEKLPLVEEESKAFAELEQTRMSATSIDPIEGKSPNNETEDMEYEETVEDQKGAEMLESFHTNDERESSKDPSGSREEEVQGSSSQVFEDKSDDYLKTQDEPGNNVWKSSSSAQDSQNADGQEANSEGLAGKRVASPFSIDIPVSSSNLNNTEKSGGSNVTVGLTVTPLRHEVSQSFSEIHQSSGVQISESGIPGREERPKHKEAELHTSSSHMTGEKERGNRDRSGSRERSRRDRDYDRHRDRDRHRDYDRNRDRDRERHRDRDRHYDRDRARDRGRDRSRERDRYRDRSRDRGRDRSRDRERDRSRDRDRERDRSRDRGRDRDRSRDRDRYYRDKERKYRDERSYR